MFVENIYLRILFFIAIIGSFLGLLFLVFWRSSVAFGFGISLKYLLLISVLSFILFLLGFVFGNNSGVAGIYSSMIIGFFYTLLFLLPIFLLRDLLSIRYKIPAFLILIFVMTYLFAGIYLGTSIKTTKLTIQNTGLARDYNFVFISDLHIQSLRNSKYLKKIVNKIQTLNPEFVLIGGDLFDRFHPDYVGFFKAFDDLDIPVYATVGNHEKIGNSEFDVSYFEGMNLSFLRNQKVFFEDVQIVGIDDKSFWGDKKLEDILLESEIEESHYAILVSHQPQKLSSLKNFPIDLQLAGHTHRGQIIPISWIVGWFNDYVYGRYEEGNQIVFVSQGIGTWGAPIRFGSQSEMVYVELRK